MAAKENALKILVVDDQKPIRIATGRLINAIGYQAELTQNSYEAIKLFKMAYETNAPFTSVILDINMPGDLEGTETIKYLQRIDPEVKAIVSSADTTHPAMINFESYGFKGALPKPYYLSELSSVLNKVTITQPVVHTSAFSH